jgi:hypothetical protein
VAWAMNPPRATFVLSFYAKRSAGRAARRAALAANPGSARRSSASTRRVK